MRVKHTTGSSDSCNNILRLATMAAAWERVGWVDMN